VSEKIEIEGLAPGGEGMGRVAGRPVFIPFTAPGDLVLADLPAGEDATHARMMELLRAGPDRVDAPCPHFGPGEGGDRLCGGCEWLHLRYDLQLRSKERGLVEALRRIGRFEPGSYGGPSTGYAPSILCQKQFSDMDWRDHFVLANPDAPCKNEASALATAEADLAEAFGRKQIGGTDADVAVSLKDPDELPGPLASLVRRAQAGARDDGARIVLGIEGGGLAVAMACGMALALERLGLTQWLDAVYGTSSGSLMAAYVAGGTTADGERVLEDVCTREFVSFTRLGRAPVVSIDHLFGVVRRRPPVVGAPGRPELRVLAARISDGRLDTLGPLTDHEDALAAVRASMAIPVWSGPAVAYREEIYSDGGLIESVPVSTPLAEGATHVIALRSRDAAYRKGRHGRLYGLAEDAVASRLPGDLRRLVRERPGRYDAEADALQAAAAGAGALAGRATQIAPPPGTPLVGRLQVDRDRVRAAVAAGTRAALAALTPAGR